MIQCSYVLSYSRRRIFKDVALVKISSDTALLGIFFQWKTEIHTLPSSLNLLQFLSQCAHKIIQSQIIDIGPAENELNKRSNHRLNRVKYYVLIKPDV